MYAVASDRRMRRSYQYTGFSTACAKHRQGINNGNSMHCIHSWFSPERGRYLRYQGVLADFTHKGELLNRCVNKEKNPQTHTNDTRTRYTQKSIHTFKNNFEFKNLDFLAVNSCVEELGGSLPVNLCIPDPSLHLYRSQWKKPQRDAEMMQLSWLALIVHINILIILITNKWHFIVSI